MKKLKLNVREFNNTEVLTRSQLKNVLGGYAGMTGEDGNNCPSGKTDCYCDGRYMGCLSPKACVAICGC